MHHRINVSNLRFWRLLHYKEIAQQERRRNANTYMTYENECDFSGLTFPVKAYDIVIFEHKNPRISIYAHQYVNNSPKCLYKSIQPEAEKISIYFYMMIIGCR